MALPQLTRHPAKCHTTRGSKESVKHLSTESCPRVSSHRKACLAHGSATRTVVIICRSDKHEVLLKNCFDLWHHHTAREAGNQHNHNQPRSQSQSSKALRNMSAGLTFCSTSLGWNDSGTIRQSIDFMYLTNRFLAVARCQSSLSYNTPARVIFVRRAAVAFGGYL